jgi:hypothetical protein
MLKDSRLMPDEPNNEGEGKKLFMNALGVVVAFLVSALIVHIFTMFGVNDDDAKVIRITLGACLLLIIVLMSFGKFSLAYLVAISPVPVLYLMAVVAEGPTTRKWTEDVLLDDGSIIQVRRMVKFQESNSLSGDAYNAVELDASISFTGSLKELPPWRVPLMPIVMYQDKGTKEWVVVAMTTSSDVWRKHGKPCPEYWEYRLNDGGWHRVPLSSASIGRPANLLHQYQKRLGTSHVTIKFREERESDAMIGKEFRTIIPKEEAFCWTAFH